MKRHALPLLLIAFTLCAPCRAIAVSRYVLTDLGDLPGGKDESYATGINSMGQVVGWSGTDTFTRGFLWSPNTPNGTAGTTTDLGSLRPGGQSFAFGINSQGQIVGYASGTPNAAFLWTPTAPNATSGVMVPIRSDQFYDGFIWPNSVNSHGQVVGDGRTETGTSVFLWTPDSPNGSTGGMGDIVLQNRGGEGVRRYAINSFGQVVGSGFHSDVDHGFVWTPMQANGTTGTFTLFDSPSSIYGQRDTGARAINDSGRVVGWTGVIVVTPNGPYITQHAAMWVPTTPNGADFSFVDLGMFNNRPSEASAINSQGHVVGNYQYDVYTEHAFLWAPTTPNGTQGNMIDLNQLLPLAEQARWTLTEPTGINDFGQIVGNALFDADGPGGNPAVPRGFVLTPVPEPSAAACFATLVALLSGNRMLLKRLSHR